MKTYAKKPRSKRRPKAVKVTTRAKLKQIAHLQARGLSGRDIAKVFDMDYDALRNFLEKHRADFERFRARIQK